MDTIRRVREKPNVSENAGILELSLSNGGGLEVCVSFKGKTYIPAFVGDSRGMILAERS